MTTPGSSRRWRCHLRTHLPLIMILITLPVIGAISFLDYREVEETLIAGDDLFREETEANVVRSLRLVDTGLKLFDRTLDSRMVEGFGPVFAEYERAGNDPGGMDLARIQEDLGEGMDIYIINESGVIEYSTYPPDIGLDFKGAPEFYERITDIRLGDTIVVDRVVVETAGGSWRKFAYMPSPDHRYVLEIGLACDATRADRYILDFRTLRDDLMRSNPALRDIRIYDRYGRIVDAVGSGGPIVPGAADPVVASVFEERESRTIADEDSGTITRYVFIDLSDPVTPSDASRVAGLTYTTALLGARIAAARLNRIIVVLFVSLAACCIAILVSRRITRPIQEIVHDVDRIAGGDLDHPIQVSAGTEFARLSESISVMVTALKENIQRLRESEEALRERDARLDDLVRVRAAELEESSEVTNFFLDVMVHDINNANAVAIGYTQFLVDTLEGEQQKMAQKMLAGLQQSSSIVGRVATLREAREGGAALVRVDLDRVIRAQMADHPEVRIRYEGSSVFVLADDLLPAVFSNLIGNAVKFGGPDVDIVIRVEECGDEVRVSVEDTGPGIPDTVKDSLFGRFWKGSGHLSGLGLGLYICRTLIERYGGRIRAEDRVEGRPECGTAIRFTLKIAGET
ncbi:MAG: HAMP domain-containing histidine kinase [Methanomicrobiales archaeon]|nr:HAMP domain-containing histidine kinase [Methanomicrobiales archaeon]